MKLKAVLAPVEINLPDRTFQVITGAACFNEPYHYHEAIELICIVKGKATLFAGNYTNTCEAGNLYLIGKNLAHTIHRVDEDEAEVVILHCKENVLGDRFFLIKEFLPIEGMLKESSQGIKWTNCCDDIIPLIENLQRATGVSVISNLLLLLSKLAHLGGNEMLIPSYFHHRVDGAAEEKIAKVCAYTEKHYKEAISLAQIASVINFTETSFCRYFKMQTGKSYFQYLNEVRIDNACRILIEEENHDIEEVCFTCGFSSPSTFYKQFKKIVKLTPKEYQQLSKKHMLTRVA